MFRAFLAALLLAALLLAALPAALASAAAPGGPPAAAAAERSALGWDDVVRLAAAAPSLAAGRLEVAAAARRVDEALAVPNPTLGAGVGQGIARYGDETRVEWGLSLAVPLDWLYRRAAAADAARAGVGAAAAELAGARLELLDRLRVVFWRMAGAQAAALDLAALEEDAAAFAAAVQARVDHGEGRPPEGTRAALEVEAVRAARVRAEARRAAAQAELAAWLGLPDPGAVAAAAGFEEPPALPDRERLLARVAARHPGVRRAAADVAVAAAAVEEERSRRLPGLEVTPFFESELDRDAWGVEVGVELPLWNWNGAGIARAEAEQAAAAERAAAVGRAVQAELAAAWGRCALRREAAVRHAGEVLPRTAALVTAEEESWRLGEAGLLEVLDARRTLAEARRAWRAALLDAWLDCSALALLERELDEDAPARDTAGFDGGLR